MFLLCHSFHSLHHTQFRTNYSLFMSLYDYIYGTTDNVVHLTHRTTLEFIYHLRLGFAYMACKPYTPKWYFCLMWPVTTWSMILTWVYGRTFFVVGNRFWQTQAANLATPKYNLQVFFFSIFSFPVYLFICFINSVNISWELFIYFVMVLITKLISLRSFLEKIPKEARA